MIVDCYTHIWDSPSQVGLDPDSTAARPPMPAVAGGDDVALDAGITRHLAACEPVDRTIVLGFESAYLQAEIPNAQVAAYVRQHPEKLIGFAGIDPAVPREAVGAMRRARQELGLRGISLAPAAQDFHPSASTAWRIYQAATELEMPVLFHSGPYLARRSKMEYARPVLLDEVAREFPGLKIVIAHLGYPWVSEALVLLAKHDNVYADISWLLHQPWEAYQALLSAWQYGVMDNLLFGSGFPYTCAANCIAALYSINHLVQGTDLPTIPREQLRSIVERDALDLLGIEDGSGNGQRQRDRTVLDDEG